MSQRPLPNSDISSINNLSCHELITLEDWTAFCFTLTKFLTSVTFVYTLSEFSVFSNRAQNSVSQISEGSVISVKSQNLTIYQKIWFWVAKNWTFNLVTFKANCGASSNSNFKSYFDFSAWHTFEVLPCKTKQIQFLKFKFQNQGPWKGGPNYLDVYKVHS